LFFSSQKSLLFQGGATDRDWEGYILKEPYRSYELLHSQKLPTRKENTFVIAAANTKRTGSTNDKIFFTDLIKEHIYDGMLCSAILQDDVKSITGTIHRFQKQNLTDEKAFVLNHIVMGDLHVTRKLVKTAYGSKIPSSMGSSRPSFGCATALKPPVKYCNTTIYFIDNVGFLPRPLSTLTLSIYKESSRGFEMENDRLYTFFAPTNDALSNNQIKALKADRALNNNFVKTHVFEGPYIIS
uniref:FAS1 domain-containing protein n=1 Tax=Gongylonema pulchrum TaxID=637853 RepID=A0A183E3L9_9BILA